MEDNIQNGWSKVKKIRFHHKVKRFYYKNLFRKIYTIAIIGLIGANIFSVAKYVSFADEMAELEIAILGDDMSRTITLWNDEPGIVEDEELETMVMGDDVLETDISGDDIDNLDISGNDVLEVVVKGDDTYSITDVSGNGIFYKTPQELCDAGNCIVYVDTQGNSFPMGTIELVNGTKSFTILDRNLGATSTGNGVGTDKASYGYLFQWGNNYGFYSNSGIYFPVSSNPVDGSLYSWRYPYINSTYINYYENWANSYQDDVWGDITNQDYAKQGPCPAGWHIPSISELDDFIGTYTYAVYGITFSNETIGSNYSVSNGFIRDFHVGRAGVIEHGGPSRYGYNTRGYRTMTTPVADSTRVRRMVVGNGSLGTNSTYALRASMASVRCFKNSTDASTVKLSFDSNGGQLMNSQTVPLNGTAHTPGYDPNMDGYEFMGRYMDSNMTIPLVFGETIFIEDTTVYAKWKHLASDCTTNYHDEDGECIYNTKTDNCTPGTVDNGHYIVEPVEITWNEEIENWNSVACTQLVCDTHYHTGSNNDSCEIDIFTITFDANLSGVNNPPTQTVTGGEMIGTLPVVSSGGYIFTGWYDGDELVTGGTIFSKDTDITLVARWTCAENYHLDNGLCVNQKITTCLTGNATGVLYDIKDVIVDWNTGANDWYDTPACEIVGCADGYHETKITIFTNGNLSIYWEDAPDYIDTDGNVFEMGSLTINNGVNEITILDRHLGAISMSTGVDGYGYYYQWGNNYGFKASGRYLTCTSVKSRVNTSSYSWNKPYVNNVYHNATGNPWTWQSVDNPNLWGGGSDTSTSQTNPDYMRQGPCPAGYHVPKKGDWEALQTLMGGLYSLDNYVNLLYIPNIGSVYNGTTQVALTDSSIQLFSSTQYNSETVWGLRNGVSIQSQLSKESGRQMRCFKNSDLDNTVLLSFDTMGGIRMPGQMVPIGGNGHGMGYNPKKPGYVFDGWYKDREYTISYSFENDMITEDTVVYAKWRECTAGEGGVCSENFGTGVVYSSNDLNLNESDDMCESNEKMVTCKSEGKPDNSTYNIQDVPVTWNPATNNWNTPDSCGWNCNTNYHTGLDNNSCVSNTIRTGCIQGWKPDNSSYDIQDVPVIWNGSGYSTPENCGWTCDTYYHTGTNNDSCEIDTFTITWKDGDDTLKSETLAYGAIPSYNTWKDYYTFLRWDPSILPVAGDQTYTAVWKANTDANGNNIADEEEPHHILTIMYMDSKLNRFFPDYIESIVEGGYYSVASQYITHYTATAPVISGTMGTGDITIVVIYHTDTNNNGVADEKETQHTLTVNYEYSRGGTVTGSVLGSYLEGILYSIASPIITNYDADSPVVKGVMPLEDRTITVTYTPSIDENHNGYADEEEDRYSVIVHYKYSRGGVVTGDQSVVNLLTDQGYNIVSPEIQYYTADKAVVSGVIDGETMSGDFIEITVKYTPNNDANNNGIADEEEIIEEKIIANGGHGRGKSTSNSHSSAKEENPIEDSQVKVQNVPKLDMKEYNARYTPEQNTAYQFAKLYGITTTSSIKEAKMNTPITRIEMAKMLSYYAMNVLGKTPDASKGIVKFRDVSDKLDAEYDNAVTLSYQLGIMGINMPNREFRPKAYVTRGELATALSRMLYNVDDGEYKSTSKYYIPHITKLYNEGIINNTNSNMQEMRGYLMIILMRTVE